MRSYLWIPALKTVAGGVVVSSGIHMWVADTQSAKSRQDWQATLKAFEKEAARAKDSATLIKAMSASYPQAGEAASLEISSKVIKGEMKWPQ
ncbi:hypothetical protein [Uliginosibacterium sp. 31-12]|uniref:hypothetical protein n=1 Tax=Uliginosibacterium sp. 31-12 TaxID=3062781 RepID=UPI0026E47CB8|nr:hypothetical protein [Uliginosibacterium sp. 31-12]MDO6388191.1 hypothetical protein [Uliginosibacterium sp. 31-12]